MMTMMMPLSKWNCCNTRSSIYDHTACISVLLDAGADIESQDDENKIALSLAAFQGHVESIVVLFYVHVYVANELAKKAMSSQKRTRSLMRYSNFQAYLATNSDDTSTLMTVISDRLKMYLRPV